MTQRTSATISVFAATLWLAACAMAFVLLRGAPDPAEPRGRIDERRAGVEAIAALSDSRGGAWSVVKAAPALAGEPARHRWIVLCDRPGRTAMRQALVVDIDADTGRVDGIRRPIPR